MIGRSRVGGGIYLPVVARSDSVLLDRYLQKILSTISYHISLESTSTIPVTARV